MVQFAKIKVLKKISISAEATYRKCLFKISTGRKKFEQFPINISLEQNKFQVKL